MFSWVSLCHAASREVAAAWGSSQLGANRLLDLGLLQWVLLLQVSGNGRASLGGASHPCLTYGKEILFLTYMPISSHPTFTFLSCSVSSL